MIGEQVVMERAKKNAEWVQCKKCMCSFAVEKDCLNFCPNCGLQMHCVLDKNTRYGLPDWTKGKKVKTSDGFCEYCRPPVGAYQAVCYGHCINCNKVIDPKDYDIEGYEKWQKEKQKTKK